MRWPFARERELLTLRREGGSPPPDHEVLTVHADASFTLWRTMAHASRPPSPVGRFSGRLPARREAQLRAAVDACRRADPVDQPLPAGAARERVTVGRSTSSWPDDARPPAPFDALVDLTRALLAELTASPEAALALELADGSARLRHLGAAPLELDLSTATVRTVERGPDGTATRVWPAPLDGPRSVTAGPGWSYQLPFGHELADGATATAEVQDVLAFDGEFWRACSLESVSR